MTDEQARTIAEAAVAWERACATAQTAKQAHLKATSDDQGAIALPLSFGLDRWADEGDPAGEPWSGDEWGWYLGGARPDIEPGERLYVVHMRKVRGYAPVLRVETIRPGYHCIVRGGGAVAVRVPSEEPIQGFRSWRRRWWEREAEVPFAEWRTP